jgi:UPF0755 protein
VKRRTFAIAAAVLVLTLIGAGVGGWRYALARYQAPGPLAAAKAVVVPRGTPAQVGEALHQAGVIQSVNEFRAAVMATREGGTLRAAEFAFPAHVSLAGTLGVLRTARPVQHLLTIPEGLTAAQIAQLLDRTPALTGDPPVPEEGTLLPETYAYELGTTRAALAERAAAAMRRTLAELWQQRDPGLPLANPQELLILASIIERETARPEERPRVAAVFLNRLRRGMKLQSDPTVAYGVSGGAGGLDRTLTRTDLDWPTPYNTYRVAGLPPGPIASPGLAALKAAAHPAQTTDLYFVADGTGGHNFARTLDEHNRNVAHWRAQGESVVR